MIKLVRPEDSEPKPKWWLDSFVFAFTSYRIAQYETRQGCYLNPELEHAKHSMIVSAYTYVSRQTGWCMFCEDIGAGIVPEGYDFDRRAAVSRIDDIFKTMMITEDDVRFSLARLAELGFAGYKADSTLKDAQCFCDEHHRLFARLIQEADKQ